MEPRLGKPFAVTSFAMRRSSAVLIGLLLTACSSPPPSNPAVTTVLAPDRESGRRLAGKMLTDTQLMTLGAQPEDSPIPFMRTETTKFIPLETCLPELSLSTMVNNAVKAAWATPGQEPMTVNQTVAAYDDVPAADAVAEIEQALSCGQHETKYGTTKIEGTATLPPPDGIDRQYAFCDVPLVPGVPGTCYLLMAEGAYATVVTVFDSKSARDQLAKIAPLVAASLSTA